MKADDRQNCSREALERTGSRFWPRPQPGRRLVLLFCALGCLWAGQATAEQLLNRGRLNIELMFVGTPGNLDINKILDDYDVAHDVFKQIGIEVLSSGSVVGITPSILGANFTLEANGATWNDFRKLREWYWATHPGTSVYPVFYVPANLDRGSWWYSFFYDTPGQTAPFDSLKYGPAGTVVSRSAGQSTLAHELGHVLLAGFKFANGTMAEPWHLKDPKDLMYPDSGGRGKRGTAEIAFDLVAGKPSRMSQVEAMHTLSRFIQPHTSDTWSVSISMSEYLASDAESIKHTSFSAQDTALRWGFRNLLGLIQSTFLFVPPSPPSTTVTRVADLEVSGFMRQKDPATAEVCIDIRWVSPLPAPAAGTLLTNPVLHEASFNDYVSVVLRIPDTSSAFDHQFGVADRGGQVSTLRELSEREYFFPSAYLPGVNSGTSVYLDAGVLRNAEYLRWTFSVPHTLDQGTAACDFNGNGALDSSDVGKLAAHIGETSTAFDVTGDGHFGLRDLETILATQLNTKLGDANLDGVIDESDLAALAARWQAAGDWTQGDFDCDGLVGTNDLLILARNWSGTPTNWGGLNLPLSDPTMVTNQSLSVSAFQLVWTAPAGSVQRIESSSDLRSWSTELSSLTNTSGASFLCLPRAEQPRCFYRVSSVGTSTKPVVQTGRVISAQAISWPSETGKRYQIQAYPVLPDGTDYGWNNVTDILIGTGARMTRVLPAGLPHGDGTNLFRVLRLP